MSLAISPTKRQLVIDEITKNIQSGTLEKGTRLATVRDMAKHFNVSISVVQCALRELLTDGMLECRGASGFYVAANIPHQEAETEKPTSRNAGRIFLTCSHHSDLMWRRTYREYDKLREIQIHTLFHFAEKYPTFHCFFDQSEVVRIYLEKHPEKLPVFRKLIDESRLELAGGFCIPDLNMISGESILRNLLEGKRFYRETFGKNITLASMTDAFGMSAQLPQILKSAGYTHLIAGRMPNIPNDLQANRPFEWQAADGTGITVINPTGYLATGDYQFNVPTRYPAEIRLAQTLSAAKETEGDVFINYMTEEELLNEDLFWIMDAVNRKGGRCIEFGAIHDFIARIPENLPVIRGEVNPVFTGCYTTRCEIKKQLRKLENDLFKTEFLLESASDNNLQEAWQELFMSQFHDAICGCHTDAASTALQKRLKNAEQILHSIRLPEPSASTPEWSIYNFTQNTKQNLLRFKSTEDIELKGLTIQRDGEELHALAPLPRFGKKNFSVSKQKCASGKKIRDLQNYVFENPYFRVSFHEKAEPVIVDLTRKNNIFPKNGFGEILFRFDAGTMWTEQYFSDYYGQEHFTESLTEIIEGPVFTKFITEGEALPGIPMPGNTGNYWEGFGSLRFRKEYRFYRESDFFTLNLSLDWSGFDTKISIRFPVELNPVTAGAVYEIPFGSLERKPYFEVPYEFESTALPLQNRGDYQSAKGDWPALEWVNYSDATTGLTVVNTGTPGHQIVGKEILVSLLRSGTGIKDGCMKVPHDAFDNGHHEYEFAFSVHSGKEIERAGMLARNINRRALVLPKTKQPEGSLIDFDADHVEVSALYHSGNDAILRLYETIGRTSEFTLRSGYGEFELYKTDAEGCGILEAIPEKHIKLRPFEISTFKLCFKK